MLFLILAPRRERNLFCKLCNVARNPVALQLNPRYDSGRTHPYHPMSARFLLLSRRWNSSKGLVNLPHSLSPRLCKWQSGKNSRVGNTVEQGGAEVALGGVRRITTSIFPRMASSCAT